MAAWLGSHYIKNGFKKDYIKRIVKTFGQIIKDKVFPDFNGIACMGTSGLAIAPILAYKYNKHLLVARKDKDNSHRQNTVECNDSITKYIIVDDFVSSGNTLKNILAQIKTGFENHSTEPPKYLGAFLWCETHKCLAKEMIAWREKPEELMIDKTYCQMKDGDGYNIDEFDYAKYLINNPKEI